MRCNKFITGLLLLFACAVHANEPDWTAWDSLLKASVSRGVIDGVELNRLDYFLLRTDPRFEQVVNDVASFDVSALQNKEEKLAFYINVYNIYAIKMVLDHWPLTSIKDAGSLFTSVWKMPVGIVAGRRVSLNDIEHEILRKMGEPKIHMAIVCASVSCPDLRAEAYTAKRLNEQLDEQSRGFLSNRMKGLRVESNALVVSKIFDWFEDDFVLYGGVKGFIRKYAADVPVREIDADLPYNWNLNIKR